MPLLFVVLWATGFVGAKFGLPYAEPFTLLLIRMLANVAVFACLVRLFLAPRLNLPQAGHAMVVGVLVHAVYLGGVFAAIDRGMAAGMSSLLVGMQPILTAALASLWLRERLRARQIGGSILGVAGVLVVVGFGGREFGSLDFGWDALAFNLAALAGISAGALYQKRFCGKIDLVSGALFQYVGASLVLAGPAVLLESRPVDWTLPLVLVLGWMIFALSTVAVLLLMFMIREGQAAKVASYFYLVPGVTALMSWFAFDETLTSLGLAGLCISAVGVYVFVRT